MCLYSRSLSVSVSSTKYYNSFSASLWYISVLTFICETTSVILIRCSLLSDLAYLVFYSGTFSVVLLVYVLPSRV